jgi:hypothetical protein
MRAAIVSALLVATAICRADIIDRIAVSVDNTVITLSEVLRQIRITAMLNGEEPVFTAESKREAAERLVNQSLIRREINISRYVPDNTEQAEILYKNFRGRYKSEAEYNAALAKYHLIDADIRGAFAWQATFLDFVEVRFRPGITIPDEEIRTLYDERIRGKTSPEATLSFEEARPKLEEELMQQRVDNALDRWLGQTMTQTRIVYRREALQ